MITLLLGAYAAMFQNDLKGLLAYSTISHLGLITLLLGLNSPLAAVAAVFHMMNHATFKASLFMSVGIIDHETGSRDMRRLDGLYRFMPITGTLAIVACAAMAGVPLLNGFLSKEMFFAETVFVTAQPVGRDRACRSRRRSPACSRSSIRCASATTCSSARRRKDLPRQPHEPVRWMRVPVELLVLACVVVGTVPAWSIGPLLATAARPVVGGTLPDYSLAVWHGFNTPLLMSLVAMAGGIAVYLAFGSRFKQRALEARAAAAPLRRQAAVRAHAGSARPRWRGARCGWPARGGCSRSCSWMLVIAGAAGARLGADRAAGLGRSGARAGHARVRAALADRRRRCHRRRVPGQVPPPRRAGDAVASSAWWCA